MPRVKAANENMVKYLKHPISKVGFTDMNTAVNWPNDSFTARRIRDGDVVVVEEHKAKEHRDKRRDARRPDDNGNGEAA